MTNIKKYFSPTNIVECQIKELQQKKENLRLSLDSSYNLELVISDIEKALQRQLIFKEKMIKKIKKKSSTILGIKKQLTLLSNAQLGTVIELENIQSCISNHSNQIMSLFRCKFPEINSIRIQLIQLETNLQEMKQLTDFSMRESVLNFLSLDIKSRAQPLFQFGAQVQVARLNKAHIFEKYIESCLLENNVQSERCQNMVKSYIKLLKRAETVIAQQSMVERLNFIESDESKKQIQIQQKYKLKYKQLKDELRSILQAKIEIQRQLQKLLKQIQELQYLIDQRQTEISILQQKRIKNLQNQQTIKNSLFEIEEIEDAISYLKGKKTTNESFKSEILDKDCVEVFPTNKKQTKTKQEALSSKMIMVQSFKRDVTLNRNNNTHIKFKNNVTLTKIMSPRRASSPIWK